MAADPIDDEAGLTVPGRYAGADWLRASGKALSSFGARAADLVGWWQKGIYHIAAAALKADWSNEDWVSLNVWCHGWSTYDGSELTALVIAGHDLAIRVELSPVAPRIMRIMLHPRRREGSHQYERHPSLERHISAIRTRW